MILKTTTNQQLDNQIFSKNCKMVMLGGLKYGG